MPPRWASPTACGFWLAPRPRATIYGATDVFLLTSRNEGTPVALIEAMAVRRARRQHRRRRRQGCDQFAEVGLLAPFGDADGLAAHVNALAADPVRRSAMGALARTGVVTRYSIDRLVTDVAALYRDLLRER